MSVQPKFDGLTVTDYTFTCTVNEVEKAYKIDIIFNSQDELLQAAAKQVAVRIGQRIRVNASGKGKGKPYNFPPRGENDPSVRVDVNGDFKKTIDEELLDNPEQFRRDTIRRLQAIARKNGQELTPAMIAMLTGEIAPAKAPVTEPVVEPVVEPASAPASNGKPKNRNVQKNVAGAKA